MEGYLKYTPTKHTLWALAVLKLHYSTRTILRLNSRSEVDREVDGMGTNSHKIPPTIQLFPLSAICGSLCIGGWPYQETWNIFFIQFSMLYFCFYFILIQLPIYFPNLIYFFTKSYSFWCSSGRFQDWEENRKYRVFLINTCTTRKFGSFINWITFLLLLWIIGQKKFLCQRRSFSEASGVL